MSIYDIKVKVGKGKAAKHFSILQAGYDAKDAQEKTFTLIQALLPETFFKIGKANSVINNK